MASQALSASANVLKGDPPYPDGSPVEIDGAPGSYKARPPVEPGTAATLVTDYE
jgi:hypothetical protein